MYWVEDLTSERTMSESNPGQRRQHGAPVFILDEDSEQTAGRDAQQTNIEAGKAIAEAVRTTLGPQGMDKMLVSDSGDVVITDDGAAILAEMDIEHPAAQMLADVADEQEAALGDGTTTAAEAFDAVPRTLARNAGRDPIDTLVQLRADNQEGRASLVVGEDVEVADPADRGVLDPAAVKRESIRSAVEVATMILRIDDVITAD